MMNEYNSKVTLELREIVNGLDENGKPFDIWNFAYPSFYEGEEKKAFEQKVIDHYYFRQIGSETVARWLHMFRTRIREIMPYYTQLYKTVKIMDEIDDPFGNVDVTETYTETRTGSGSGTYSDTSETENTSTVESGATDTTTYGSEDNAINNRRFSNTPQGSIKNLDNYMTEATAENNKVTKTGTDTIKRDLDTSETVIGSGSSSSETSSETSESVEHTLTRKGNQGVNTYAHDMKEYREIIINIDMMIINELADLFLLVY